MAQFRATIQGARGPASRLGHKNRGITAIINGWNTGIRVHAFHKDGKDIFTIVKTDGSNGNGMDKLIAEVSADA